MVERATRKRLFNMLNQSRRSFRVIKSSNKKQTKKSNTKHTHILEKKNMQIHRYEYYISHVARALMMKDT